LKRIFYFFCALGIAYVIAYAILSANGRYQPLAFGLNGVKGYAWAPWGFYDPDHPWENSVAARKNPGAKTGGWNTKMIYFFMPLWELDRFFIHDQRYPANLDPD
jgi:hypothetical protein